MDICSFLSWFERRGERCGGGATDAHAQKGSTDAGGGGDHVRTLLSSSSPHQHSQVWTALTIIHLHF